VNVFVADEQGEPLPAEPLRRLAERVLTEEGLPVETEVALLFVEPGQMAEYNERFMGRSGPTDVLAFPLEDLQPGDVPVPLTNGPPFNLGDVIISPKVVAEGARRAGASFEDELALIVVHGLLHLLGYDHQTDQEADEMESRERELLAGYPPATRGRPPLSENAS
jgi:probable rRNA maturation factor